MLYKELAVPAAEQEAAMERQTHVPQEITPLHPKDSFYSSARHELLFKCRKVLPVVGGVRPRPCPGVPPPGIAQSHQSA